MYSLNWGDKNIYKMVYNKKRKLAKCQKIWPIGLRRKIWPLRNSLIWAVFFEEIEFELGQIEEMGKTEGISSQVDYESKNILCWSTIFVWKKNGWARIMITKQDKILETRPLNLNFIFALWMPFCVALGSWSRNRF